MNSGDKQNTAHIEIEKGQALPSNSFFNVGAWQALNSGLHIGDLQFMQQHCSQFSADNSTSEKLMEMIISEGYFQLSSLDWGLDIKMMADAVMKIDNSDFSPPFAFIYDEFWVLFHKLHTVLGGLLGNDYKILPDFWVWRVNPERDDRGWSPHRDKGRTALFEDGTPKSITVWIALSESTPLNGCMYMIPAHRDPTYNTPQENDFRFDYADIRALPAQAGDTFFWNQAVLHWGSHSSQMAQNSRVSLAFEFQRADIEPMNHPLLVPLQMYDFNSRLRLIAKQILQYQHMYQLDPKLREFAETASKIQT